MATKEVDKAQVIEVERKFLFPDDIEEKLHDHGAVAKQQKSFIDIYYDTPRHELTLADHWLRQRQGSWQLKVPPSQRLHSNTTAQYREHENEDDILQALLSILDLAPAKRPSSMEEFVTLFDCKPFATFQTRRTSYSLKNFILDLDRTDFGYKVGEIETIVESSSQIEKALGDIDEIAEELGRYRTIGISHHRVYVWRGLNMLLRSLVPAF